MKFAYKNYLVDVEINRKNIKNLYVRVRNGRIIVNANTYTSDKYIRDLLERERTNIENMLEKEENRLQPKDKIYYLGEEYKYTYSNIINIDENSYTGPSIDIINEYLEKKSLNVFETRLNMLKNMFKDLPEFKLKIRKMKTRWGVCNKKSMSITLNTELIHKDVSLIDYVIIHELCQLKQSNPELLHGLQSKSPVLQMKRHLKSGHRGFLQRAESEY